MKSISQMQSSRWFKVWYTYNRILITSGALLMLTSVVAMLISRQLPQSVAQWLIFAPFFGGVALQFLTTRDVWCPVCQNCFYGRDPSGGSSNWNIFSRKCKHCGYDPRSGRKPTIASSEDESSP